MAYLRSDFTGYPPQRKSMKIRTKLLAIWQKVEVASLEVEQRFQELRQKGSSPTARTSKLTAQSQGAPIQPQQDSAWRMGDAGVQILRNRMRLSTLALAALIFGIAGLSALWLFVIAGLAVLCSVPIALVARVSRRAQTINSP